MPAVPIASGLIDERTGKQKGPEPFGVRASLGELEDARLRASLPRTGLVITATGRQPKLLGRKGITSRHGQAPLKTDACKRTPGACGALAGRGVAKGVHDEVDELNRFWIR